MTTTTRISTPAYWYLSAAASDAIDRVMADDGRRTWHPCSDSLSLATLRGAAKNYADRYGSSRYTCFAAAGVRVTEIRGPHNRRVGIVTLPGEPRSAAVRIQRTGRGVRTLRATTHSEDLACLRQLPAADIMAISNVELRREVLETELQRVISDLGIVPESADDCGTLYRVPGAEEDTVYVRVTDPSTGREYWLRVPPEVQTAREAVAWTYDVPLEEYQPLVEA